MSFERSDNDRSHPRDSLCDLTVTEQTNANTNAGDKMKESEDSRGQSHSPSRAQQRQSLAGVGSQFATSIGPQEYTNHRTSRSGEDRQCYCITCLNLDADRCSR